MLSEAIAADDQIYGGRPTPQCALKVLLDLLDADDRPAVEKLLEDKARVTGTNISAFLLRQADAVSKKIETMKPGKPKDDAERLLAALARCKAGPVRNHRNESCGCYTRR